MGRSGPCLSRGEEKRLRLISHGPSIWVGVRMGVVNNEASTVWLTRASPSISSFSVGSSLVLDGSGDTIPSSGVLGVPLADLQPEGTSLQCRPQAEVPTPVQTGCHCPAPRTMELPTPTSSTPCFSFPLPLWAPLHLCTCFSSAQSCLLTSGKHSRPRPWPLNQVA